VGFDRPRARLLEITAQQPPRTPHRTPPAPAARKPAPTNHARRHARHRPRQEFAGQPASPRHIILVQLCWQSNWLSLPPATRTQPPPATAGAQASAPMRARPLRPQRPPRQISARLAGPGAWGPPLASASSRPEGVSLLTDASACAGRGLPKGESPAHPALELTRGVGRSREGTRRARVAFLCCSEVAVPGGALNCQRARAPGSVGGG